LSLNNALLLVAEGLLYFGVMAALFRLRHLVGLGVFICALGSLHFLETYLAAVLYVPFIAGTAISPGSIVLFSGKLVMLLLLYIREDATAVRQPIYGLLIGNFLIVSLVMLLRLHDVMAPVPNRVPDFQLMDQMGGLMVWGTILLFIDSILIILLYERLGARLRRRITARIWISAAAVLTFDQVGFFLALYLFVGVPIEVLFGGWLGKMFAAALYAVLTGAYLRWFERSKVRGTSRPLADVFDALTYRERYHALLERTGRDGLTGLGDRGRLEEQGPLRIADALAANKPLSLILIDVDDFKQINDRYGHSIGDQVLKLVGDKLSDIMRGADAIYRYGGDEFVVLCSDLAHDRALSVAERLRETIETLSEAEGLPITVSVGVATCPADATGLAALFARADARLYEGKSTGRNRVVGEVGAAKPEQPLRARSAAGAA
jgi:diguanylate cyclase (GGDEF)-like protein